MIRILEAKPIAPYQILLEFSDGSQRVWSAETLLATRKGTTSNRKQTGLNKQHDLLKH